jgi:hypothetical protein
MTTAGLWFRLDESRGSRQHDFVAMPTSAMVEGVNATPIELRKVREGLCFGGQVEPSHWE